MNLPNSEYFMQIAAVFTACFNGISYGIDRAWTSPYLPQLLGNSTEILVTETEGFVCAVIPIVGQVVGGIIAIWTTDYFGRKKTILFTAPIMIAAFSAIGFFKSIWIFNIARCVAGCAEGMSYVALPMYIGEVTSPKIRGVLAALTVMYIYVGMAIINAVGPYMTITESSFIVSALSILQLFSLVWMPESPYFFIKKKQFEEAKQSFALLHPNGNVDYEIKELVLAVEMQEDLHEKSSYLDIFKEGVTRRAAFIIFLVSSADKLSGSVVVYVYTEIIFQKLFGVAYHSYQLIIICYAIQVSVLLVFSYFIDKVGRRYITLVSVAGCGICLFLISAYFFYIESFNGIKYWWMPSVFFALFLIFYSAGICFSPMVFLSELFPINLKGKAGCLIDIYNAMVSVLSCLIFELLKNSVGFYVPFLIFGICELVLLILCWKYVPETKNKTLEAIQIDLLSSNCLNAKVKF